MPIRSRHMQHPIPRLPIHSHRQHLLNSTPLTLAERLDRLAEIAQLARAREVDQVIGFVFGEGGRHCVCLRGCLFLFIEVGGGEGRLESVLAGGFAGLLVGFFLVVGLVFTFFGGCLSLIGRDPGAGM